MLIQFKIKNFLSFNTEAVFSMAAGTSTQHKRRVLTTDKNLSILKTTLIYGPNASGKSNFVKALDFLQDLMIHLELKKGQPIQGLMPFLLDKKSQKLPSSFEIDFFINNRVLSYGVILDSNSIVEESLSEVKGDRTYNVFKRNSTVEFSKKYFKNLKDDSRLRYIAEDLLPNQLFISMANRRKLDNIDNADILSDCYKWFKNTLVIVSPSSRYSPLELRLKNDNDFSQKFSELLKGFDTEIENLHLEETTLDKVRAPEAVKQDLLLSLTTESEKKKNEKVALIFEAGKNERYIFINEGPNNIKIFRLVAEHKTLSGESINFELSEESDGTRRIFDLIPMLLNIKNKTYVIDEVNRSLHPNLTEQFLEKMNDYLESNNSQIITTTHETTIMDSNKFRRDEIWFVEKSRKTKASTMFSLDEFKVRPDLSFNKAYLQGRFGALPCFKSVR